MSEQNSLESNVNDLILARVQRNKTIRMALMELNARINEVESEIAKLKQEALLNEGGVRALEELKKSKQENKKQDKKKEKKEESRIDSEQDFSKKND